MLTEALLLDPDLSVRKGQASVPAPAPGEVLVRVDWCGVCGCDLHAFGTGEGVGRWPATLGHEVAGTVAECPGGELPEGSPVVLRPRARPQPGGAAGHLVAGVGEVVACPDGLEPAIAVLAGPLAAATHAVSGIRWAGPPGLAAIFGYGPSGALVHLEIARRWPEARVVVVEPGAAQGELASAFGAEVVRELAGRDVDVAVAAATAGYPGALAGALAACRDEGTVLALGPSPDAASAALAGAAGRRVTLTVPAGCSGEPAGALASLAAAPDRYRPVITDAILLDEAPARLPRLLRSPSPGKVLIRP